MEWLSVYTLFQKKCKMNKFIFPGAQGQGHATLGHVGQAPWSENDGPLEPWTL